MTKDETNMEQLYEIVREVVAKQAGSVERFGEEREDITQEVMIKAIKNWDDFKGDCKVSSWVWRITRNTIINLSIKHSREKRKAVATYSIEDNQLEFVDSNYGEFEDNVLHDERIHALNNYVKDNLTEDEQKVFRGLLKGYGAVKISDVYGLSYVKTVEMVHKCRAIRLDI